MAEEDYQLIGEEYKSAKAGNYLSVKFIDPFREHMTLPALTNIIPKLPSTDTSGEMAPWLKNLLAKGEKRDTHLNVKLYVARLVLSFPAVFKPFAAQWWRFILGVIAAGHTFGSGINYFIEELAVLLMEWTDDVKKTLQENDRDAILSATVHSLLWKSVSKFLQRYFVENSVAEQRYEIRKNIRLIRGLVELFSDKMIAPTDSLFKLLSLKGNGTSKNSVIAGIFLLQAFAANQISPYDIRGLRDESISRQEFYAALISHLSGSLSEKYIPCAECLGFVMKCSERDQDMITLLESEMNTKLNELYTKSDRNNLKPFVVILNKISINYPEIMRSNYKRLLFVFPRLDLDLKAKSLESILSWSDQIDDLFAELMNLNLTSLLQHRDTECQTFTLRILASISEKLRVNDVLIFLEIAVDAFLYHTSERCRAAFFSLLYQLDKSGKFARLDKKTDQLVKKAFLVGLHDSDNGIRQSMSEYVNRTMFGKMSLLQRVIEVMRKWYNPQMEDIFLASSLELIISATENSPSYTESMFNSLTGIRFNDKNIAIDNTWLNNSSMQPLFAATFAADGARDTSMGTFDADGGFVRATQDMVWTPTQDLSPSVARQIYTLSTQEFDRMPSFSKTKEHLPGGTAPKLIRPSRFINSQDESSRFYFADEMDRRKKRHRKLIEQQKQSRERKVTLFRKYREGELPDIEIKYKDVILPLRALIGRDSEIAMIVFSSLFH
ncbi:NUC194 domain-containing protein [Chytridium lagenaria]|nr:NUC194 domain-containing protein [Chytridium lagenaria]